jgi:hypothetical protein
MSPDENPAADAPASVPGKSKDDPSQNSAPAPDADKAEPPHHERPPVRTDDN